MKASHPSCLRRLIICFVLFCLSYLLAHAEPSDPKEAVAKFDELKALMHQYIEAAGEGDDNESIYAEGLFREAEEQSVLMRTQREGNNLTVYRPLDLMGHCQIRARGLHAELAQRIDTIFHELDDLIIRLPRHLPQRTDFQARWIEVRLGFLRATNQGSLRLSYLCRLALNQGMGEQSLIDLYLNLLAQMTTHPLEGIIQENTEQAVNQEDAQINANRSTINAMAILLAVWYYNIHLHPHGPK